MKKANWKKTTAIAVVFMLLISLFGFFYMRFIQSMLVEEAEMHLLEVSQQGSSLVKKQSEKDFDVLEILARGQISYPDVPMEQKIIRLQQESDAHHFHRMGYADLEGNANTSDGYTFSVADRDFFQHAVAGERWISEPIADKMNPDSIGIVFSIPIYYDGEISGVLFGGYEVSKLMELINVSFYHERGKAYVVNSKGTIMLHPVSDYQSKNIFPALADPDDIEAVDQFRTHLQNREPGVSRIYTKGANRYFGYVPIEGVNDWFLVSSIPESVIFDRSTKIIKATIFFISGAFICALLVTIYIMIIRKRQRRRITQLAYYDMLTGAPNFEKFKLDGEALLARYGAEQYTLVYSDIKQFKYLNRDYGHETGDKLLIYMTACFKDGLQKDELYARVSADNFVLMLKKQACFADFMKDLDALYAQIKRCRDQMQNFYPIKFHCGIYEMTAQDTSLTEALDKANTARKHLKSLPLDEYAIYDIKMQEQLEHEKEIEQTMHAALRNGEFVPLFQPKYDLVTGKIAGAEALVRWYHPQKGMISPDAFIPLFEKNGFITDLDLFMLDEVCRKLREMIDQGIVPVLTSINQSRYYMYNQHYVEDCCAILKKYDIQPSLIELEITESAAYKDMEALVDVIARLHETGFQLSMDDFGAGYSSLNVLRRLEVDVLKLDRDFFSELSATPRGKIIVSNIIRMAKEMQIIVVAEGVETHEQVEFLKESFCDMVQGYYYSKPISGTSFEQMLAEQQGHQNTENTI